jgi:hypothetical protein
VNEFDELLAAGSTVASVAERPLERAQVVWARAIELAVPLRWKRFGVTISVLRAAEHDSAVLAHAVVLGRSHVRDHPSDEVGMRAIRLLERAIRFLGVKRHSGEVGSAASNAGEPRMSAASQHIG